MNSIRGEEEEVGHGFRKDGANPVGGSGKPRRAAGVAGAAGDGDGLMPAVTALGKAIGGGVEAAGLEAGGGGDDSGAGIGGTRVGGVARTGVGAGPRGGALGRGIGRGLQLLALGVGEPEIDGKAHDGEKEKDA